MGGPAPDGQGDNWSYGRSTEHGLGVRVLQNITIDSKAVIKSPESIALLEVNTLSSAELLVESACVVRVMSGHFKGDVRLKNNPSIRGHVESGLSSRLDLPPRVSGLHLLNRGTTLYDLLGDIQDETPLEGLSYHWQLFGDTSNISLNNPHLSTPLATILQPGSYGIRLSVLDPWKNQTVLEQQVSTGTDFILGADGYAQLDDVLQRIPENSALEHHVYLRDSYQNLSLVDRSESIVFIAQNQVLISPTTQHGLYLENCFNLTFKNFYFLGSSAQPGVHGVWLQGGKNIRFVDCDFINFQTSPNMALISKAEPRRGTQVDFENCRFLNNQQNVLVQHQNLD